MKTSKYSTSLLMTSLHPEKSSIASFDPQGQESDFDTTVMNISRNLMFSLKSGVGSVVIWGLDNNVMNPRGFTKNVLICLSK